MWRARHFQHVGKSACDVGVTEHSETLRPCFGGHQRAPEKCYQNLLQHRGGHGSHSYLAGAQLRQDGLEIVGEMIKVFELLNDGARNVPKRSIESPYDARKYPQMTETL